MQIPEKFCYQKMIGTREGNDYQNFPSIFFCLTVPNFSYGNPLVFHWLRVSKKSGQEGGESIAIFRRSFCLTVPIFFIGEHFGLSKKVFYGKFSRIGGGLGFSKFFVSEDRKEKLCKGTLQFSGSFLVSEKKLIDKRGHVTMFYRKFVVSHYRKTS